MVGVYVSREGRQTTKTLSLISSRGYYCGQTATALAQKLRHTVRVRAFPHLIFDTGALCRRNFRSNSSCRWLWYGIRKQPSVDNVSVQKVRFAHKVHPKRQRWTFGTLKAVAQNRVIPGRCGLVWGGRHNLKEAATSPLVPDAVAIEECRGWAMQNTQPPPTIAMPPRSKKVDRPR